MANRCRMLAPAPATYRRAIRDLRFAIRTTLTSQRRWHVPVVNPIHNWIEKITVFAGAGQPYYSFSQ
jgi:hypothetical protein